MVPHFKALRYGKDEKGRLSSRGISSICQDVLKNGNLLHKTGLVDSQMVGTVYRTAKNIAPKPKGLDFFYCQL